MVEQILATIRDTVSNGVEFAEDKLSQILEVSRSGPLRRQVLMIQLLTSSKLTAEEKVQKAYASVSSALDHAVTSASNYATSAGASATSAASVASVSA